MDRKGRQEYDGDCTISPCRSCGPGPIQKEEVKEMAQAFFGGIHPNDRKSATNKKPIEKMPPPAIVVLPMSMHIGAPCKPCVAVGDQVTVGQMVGEPTGFVCAPIHARRSLPWGKMKARTATVPM